MKPLILLRRSPGVALYVTVIGVFAAIAAVAYMTENRERSSTSPLALAGTPAETDRAAAEVCLAEGVTSGEAAALVSESREAFASLARNAPEAPSSNAAQLGPVRLTTEEAQRVMTFDVKLPTSVPAGWTADITSWALAGDCEVQVTMRDPAVSTLIEWPEEYSFTPEGEPTYAPAHSEEIFKEALIISQSSNEPPFDTSKPAGLYPRPTGDGQLIEQWTTVNGLDAQLTTRDYDEPSVFFWWLDKGVRVAVVCSLMTVDECRAIAESVE
jgi:hypothetical protein